jgi:hypothetical protein
VCLFESNLSHRAFAPSPSAVKQDLSILLLQHAQRLGAASLFAEAPLQDAAGALTPRQAELLLQLGWDVSRSHGGRNALHAALAGPAWAEDAAVAAEAYAVLLRTAPGDALLAQDKRKGPAAGSATGAGAAAAGPVRATLSTPLHLLASTPGAGAEPRRALLVEMLGRCVEQAPKVFWLTDFWKRTPAQVRGAGAGSGQPHSCEMQ